MQDARRFVRHRDEIVIARRDSSMASRVFDDSFIEK
jgi:hypothetical protein